MSIIFNLLTDFGLDDPYVGQMKGVLVSAVPNCRIIDLSHAIRPQNIQQAAFFLDASFDYLPAGSLSLAVIDPGVGTKRKIVLLEIGNKWVLAPDNGLLSLILQRLDPKYCLEISTEYYLAAAGSATFHGRDIFCPLAAKWAVGQDPGQLGSPLPSSKLKQLPMPKVKFTSGQIEASILHIDKFGNCILNLSIKDFWEKIKNSSCIQSCATLNRHVYPASTYAHIPDSKIGLLPGSQGYLELAINQASCAEKLNLDIGRRVSFFLPSHQSNPEKRH